MLLKDIKASIFNRDAVTANIHKYYKGNIGETIVLTYLPKMKTAKNITIYVNDDEEIVDIVINL